VLKEEHGNDKILTSQESLETWEECEKKEDRQLRK
jgi:hypothetical protein